MDKEFESWLKSELSDMKVEPTKDEIVKMFMEFAQVVLMSQKLAVDLLTPFGLEVTDEFVLSQIKASLEKALEV